MNIKYFFVLLFQLLSIPAFTQKHMTFYVSSHGRDSNPGTINKPLATLEKARDLVRTRLTSGQKDTITVFLREGNYTLKNTFELNNSDSGRENLPIIYSAYPNEKVSIKGGISIPVEKAVKVKDKEVLSRLIPTVKEKILQINLKSLNIHNYGVLSPRGFSRPYQPAPMELFCNYNEMKLSRWPNDSLIRIGKVIDPGSVPRNGDYSQRGGKFTFDTKRPERWANAKDIWISGFFHYGYADDAVKIANLDLDKKIITTVQETLYGFQGGKKFQSWYAYNLLEEIDQPGEYFIDRNSGMLYFLPPSESLTSIELSVLETPLVTIENGSYIQFRNITFECARGMGIYIEQGQGNRIENCIFRNLGLVAVSLGKGVQPLNPLQHAGSGKPASRILGSISNHLYDNPTFNREAGTDHVISGCHIYNIGAGGINLSGGDRLTLKKGKNIVENCQINNFNRLDRSYKAGVNIDGVGNIIRNCEIYNCPGSAILLHGNDHLIELNNIHHAVTDGDDMGAIYYGRDPSELGNIVKHNFFHHIGNDHGLIVSVYHDDGACGMEVTGNVFYKAGSKSVLIGGGHDNVYRNNIFINADIAFHLDNRQQNWAKGNLVKDGIFEKRLKAVNYKLPPYAAAYPKIARYFEDSPALPKGNLIENNVFVNVKMIHNGAAEWSYFGINYIADKDPGFVNYEDMNFELNVSSDIFKVLPGFKPIPFHKIGLLRETDSYEMNK